MKECVKCKQMLQLDKFSFRNKKQNLLMSVCKSCHSEYVKIHYNKNKQTYISNARVNTKKYREQNRKLMLEYLSDKRCVDCTENDIRTLDFDHRTPSKKYRAVSHMMRDFPWNKILEEIDKCDIRCANCHRKKTANQFTSYKAQ